MNLEGHRKLIFAIAMLPTIVLLVWMNAITGSDLAGVLITLIMLFAGANAIEHWMGARKAEAVVTKLTGETEHGDVVYVWPEDMLGQTPMTKQERDEVLAVVRARRNHFPDPEDPGP